MKVLHVAVFTPNSTNVWQADGFENLGHEVIRYDYRAKAVELDGKLTNNNPRRDNNLIDLCRVEKPDITLFSKCNQMHYRVVEECRKIGKTITWYMDFKWNVNQELVDKFKRSDFVFCSRWDGLDAATPYCDHVSRLQGGYNPKVHYHFDLPYTHDTVFIGQTRQDRVAYQRKVPFEILNGYYNEDHSKLVSQTKINLSFTEGDGISNRIYKLMAAKGFVLTQPWNRMTDDFEIGRDFDVFTSPQELKDKIEYYLKHDEEREIIAEHGFNTVQKYDNNNYARRIIEAVENEGS